MTSPYLAELASRRKLILASGSPRRLQLLSETGLAFRRIIPAVTEIQQDHEPPYEFALRLAQEKALSIASGLNSNEVVIGCDTIVVLGSRVLGKPRDEQDAFRILSDLSGAEHVVCTAVALVAVEGILAADYDLTRVFFNQVTPDQIREYVASGEPLDKAGAYGIQGMGAFLVDRIEGHLDNVIGLPRKLLDELARKTLTCPDRP